MKKFEGVMLSAIIITLIVSSAQTAIATDKYAPDPDLNLRYEVYSQSVVRDTHGQLLSVSESTSAVVLISSFSDGVLIPGLVDYVIDDNLLSEKKIVTISNVKYEKIQFQNEKVIDHDVLTNSPGIGTQGGDTKTGVFSGGTWKFCGDFTGKYGYQCIPMFKARMPQIHMAEDNILTTQWTILRMVN
jgi:hypothetical protein